MAPPGTSSVLRSRRRDASLKPNRSLDRTSSRGMLYENEELRLRTININAEVEKGQYYIKKLRRENQQLKKEIWNLREEYEKLENYVKSREQSENEEEDDKLLIDEEHLNEELNSTLSTVIEECDQLEQENNNSTDQSNTNLKKLNKGADDIINNNSGIHHDNSIMVVIEGTVAGPQTTSDVCGKISDAGTLNATNNNNNNNESRHGPPSPPPAPLLLCCTTPPFDTDETQQRQQQLLGVHPDAVATPAATTGIGPIHAACFDFGNQKQLQNLTVDEIIEAIDSDLREILKGIRVVDERCYMTFGTARCMERALHTTLNIRGVPVLLMDTGAGATMLCLSGVPDTVSDKEVLKSLKKYGTVIGGVERKTCRGLTGSERYVRVRLILGSPRYLWFGSNKAIVRQLTEHETGTMNSIARRKSFRSHIKLNLKMADPSSLSSSTPITDEVGKENGTPTFTTLQSAPSTQQATAFRFPSDQKVNSAEPRSISRSSIKSTTGASKKLSVGQESPIKGRRRPSLLGFRRDTLKYRGSSLSRGDGEDAESDTSTICRRKLSITGRENTEKVPWCGCWGNGCI
ncbi:uncharacterized protein LOC126896817 isoform X2 [Daktulosphaira vitifoliae]|uniref:uncharacterized protein LOC126896817 isoform X2 n=1 Tax=Daktulosphaira vitifoliae TaxID=58002 RepID=UPI0021A9D86C|nr:uncharacterized protein LOC126896817 isoform X2 [Daktulosphaira vitifoliae]